MSILTTDRTVVKRLDVGIAPFIVELVNSPGWLRFIGDRGVKDVADARRFLQEGFLKSCQKHGFGYYLVLNHQNMPLGICGFLKKTYLENPDFGFAFLPEYCGRGLALESSRAVLEFGIREYGFESLDAVTDVENLKSIRLLEKLDFVQVGLLSKDDGCDDLQLFRLHCQKVQV